jgi:2-dehydro-3-deoxyglucarate aldolase/4-hydroxy-2-oxoheptanedioate aldolase
MPVSGLKGMARDRSVKVGHFIVEFVSPGIGYLLKNAGCDFVLFDTEHSGFHNETIKSALRYFEAAGVPAIVRVPSKEYHHIARAMDMGAEGLMVPMVNDATEARAILDCMKYVPDGKRGVALGVAHADAIAALDGVDCLWVGHFDLTCSLGIPGQFDHPKFKDAIKRTYEACRKHNKAYGRLVPDVATGVDVFGQGFDFICYSGDVWTFQAAVKAGVDGIRAGCAGNAGNATAPAPRVKQPAKAR